MDAQTKFKTALERDLEETGNEITRQKAFREITDLVYHYKDPEKRLSLYYWGHTGGLDVALYLTGYDDKGKVTIQTIKSFNVNLQTDVHPFRRYDETLGEVIRWLRGINAAMESHE